MKDIGASGRVLSWIREGVTIPFLNNRPPPPFNHGVPLLDATPTLATHLRRGRTRALLGDGSMGSHHMKQIRIQIVLSRQARQQSMAIYRRPTTHE
jgi:hypothetical protein